VWRAVGQRASLREARLGATENAIVGLAEQPRFVLRWLRAGGPRDRQLEGELDLVELRVGAPEGRSEQ